MAGKNPPRPPPSNKPPNPPPPSSSQRTNKSSAAAASPSNRKPSTSNTPNKPPTPKPKPNNYTNNPSPRPDPIRPSKLPPFPFPDPPPPPTYGFHMLDRRTILLADGSVRSYFALPQDYQEFTPLPLPFRGPMKYPMSPDFHGLEYRPEMGERGDGFIRGRRDEYRNVGVLEGRGNGLGLVEGPRPVARPEIGPGNSMKRKFNEREGRDGFERQRQQLLQYGSVDGGMPGASGGGYIGRGGGEELRVASKFMRTSGGNLGKVKYNEVDQDALKKAFLHFVKVIYENSNQKKKYLADGKQGSLQCIACGRFDVRMNFLFPVASIFILLLLLLLVCDDVWLYN